MTEPAPEKKPPHASSDPATQQALPDAEPEVQMAAMPEWVDQAFPWFVSFMLHVALSLLILFAVHVTKATATNDADHEQIIIPNAIIGDTPGGITNPGQSEDPTREAMQNRIKVMSANGWAQSAANTNVSGMLSKGEGSDSSLDLIVAGAGGTMGQAGKGTGNGGSGTLASFGPGGGGAGTGPRSSFYGTGGNAMRVVFILDHSGSMIETFSFLQNEVNKTIGHMLPVQSVSVIVVSETSEVLGPKSLQRVTGDVKKELATRIDKVVPEGKNDDLLDPFLNAFQTAFTMKPQLIYFLTDGRFDGKLMDKVKELNKGKAVHINTIAFVSKDRDYLDQLKTLATSNGGEFHFVTENELGR